MQFHGDCHTHIDALCHIAYNGRPASMVTARGSEYLDITDYLTGSSGAGITREEIEAVEKASGVRPAPRESATRW